MKNPIIVFSGSMVILFSMFLFLNKAQSDNTKGKPVAIENTWELPDILQEISGLAHLKNGLFACIQDEDGVIYLYNTKNSKIEKEIPFAEPGDYEGLAVHENTAYVVKSDGELFEIHDLLGKEPTVTRYQTFFDEDNNIEGIGIDALNNRLLFVVKDKDPTSTEYKGIYAFDLKSKSISKEPAYIIRFDDPAFGDDAKKGNHKVISPSGIEIHSVSGKLYITDGKASKIIVIDKQGVLQQVYRLDKKVLQQPEGITITSDGHLFVASEGKKGPGKIVRVSGID